MGTSAIGPILDVFHRLAGCDGQVSVWWRDDDAIRATPQLERLLRLSDRTGCPVAIAAIPDRIEASLVARLARETKVRVLPHGFRHQNHGAPGAKKAEFGADRPPAALIREARLARQAVDEAFGEKALDVFVPPWNRISQGLADVLPGLGYRGLSTFARGAEIHPGRIDTHLDPVDWHGTRSLRPPADIAADLRATLESGVRTIGILTHHLAFDEALWRFCEDLMPALAEHPAVLVRGIDDLIEAPAPRHPAHPSTACDLTLGLAG